MIWNLCDRRFDYLEQNIQPFLDKGDYIQIGSYTCPQYLMRCIQEGMALELEYGTYDLVVPTFPEHSLAFLDTDAFAESCRRARQVVVNDFGMLKKLSSAGCRLRMGRLFFKDYRDPRYEEYDSGVYEGKAAGLFLFAKECGFEPPAVESDIITKQYSLSMPDGIVAYFHFPYRQIAASHICEFASIGKKIADKFVPDDSCRMQCMDVRLRARHEAAGYLKVGRNVYDLLDESYTAGYDREHMIISPRWGEA